MLWPLSVVLVANTNGRLAIPALAGLLVFTYYVTNLIEMSSNFPINMNCIFFAFTWPNLCSQLFYGHRHTWHSVNNRPVKRLP